MEKQLALKLDGGTQGQGVLETRFKLLSLESIQADDEYNSAEDHISEVLVKDYLLWRLLELDRPARDEIFTLRGLPVPADQNPPEFGSFIKAIFRLELPSENDADRECRIKDGSRRNKISRYVAVMEALDEEYERHPRDFRFEAQGKLLAFIEEAGGITKIWESRKAANAAEKLQGNGLSAAGPAEDDTKATKKWIADNALPFIKDAPSIVWASEPDLRSVIFDSDGYALNFIRWNADGKLEFGPAGLCPNALNAIAIQEASRLSNVRDLSLRLLAEVAATQSYPAQFAPSGGRANLTGPYGKWYQDTYLDEGTASKGRPVQRRLVVRRGDILLSAMRTNSSVITLLTPKHFLISATDVDVYLDPDKLRLIEEWHETGTLAARNTTPTDSLRPSPKDHRSDCYLKVKNAAPTGKQCGLFFRRIDRADDPVTDCQPELDLSNFRPTWKLAVQREWLFKLRREFLDAWFLMVRGSQLKRREHWLFNIDVTSTAISIGFKHDAVGSSASKTISRDRPSSRRARSSRASATFSVGAKDFATVFYDIANLDITGPVRISGDDAVVLLQFETALGKYKIAIPTAFASTNGVVRNSKHMTRYGKTVV